MSDIKIRSYKRYYKSLAFLLYFSSVALSFYLAILSKKYKNIEKLGNYLNGAAIAAAAVFLLSLLSMLICGIIEKRSREVLISAAGLQGDGEEKELQVEDSKGHKKESLKVSGKLGHERYLVKRERSNISLMGQYYEDYDKFVFEKPANFRFNTFSCVLMTSVAVSSLVAIYSITNILYRTQNVEGDLFDFKNPLVWISAFALSIALISMGVWIVKNIFDENRQIPNTLVAESVIEQDDMSQMPNRAGSS